MNYIHHAIIGVGTAALGVLAVEALGVPQVTPVVLGLGALAASAGSIATDLDHPKSFISNTIPLRLLRVTLAVLAIPLLAALASYLTTRDLYGTLNKVTALIWGINFLRWTAIAFFASLLLMILSLLLYKSLHHRGPLHSLLFSGIVTALACMLFWLLGASWAWGLLFGWGWLWHILADGLTDQGVPFFWPFNDKRRHTLPAWACGVGRLLLTLAAMGGMIALIIIHMQPYFV
jgi:membrane-bound metal-dependent hydrolase YbcI (DUF457 family)